jgi:hypothetical protein
VPTRLTERSTLLLWWCVLLWCSGWCVLLLRRLIPRSAGIRRERVNRLNRLSLSVDRRYGVAATLNVRNQIKEASQIVSHLSDAQLELNIRITTNSQT